MKQNVRESFIIAQISDIHCGDPRFDESLMETGLKEINNLAPDLVVVCGDLTVEGYHEPFEAAKHYIQQIECPQVVTIAGNHDCRNVGYVHFEQMIGPSYKTHTFDFCVYCGEQFQEKLKVVAVDSNKPDLNEGEIGRDHYRWIREEFTKENVYKIFVLHHHLVSVPGTGRERNIVWDAGDVLAELHETGADMVLCGHKHVPYVWPIAGMLVVNSGTFSSWRTRGFTKPSYNVIEIKPLETVISIRSPEEGVIEQQRHPRPVPAREE